MTPAMLHSLHIASRTQCCPTYHPVQPMPRMPFPVRHQVAILPKASSCLKCSGIEFQSTSIVGPSNSGKFKCSSKFSTNLARNAGSDEGRLGEGGDISHSDHYEFNSPKPSVPPPVFRIPCFSNQARALSGTDAVIPVNRAEAR